MYIKRILHLTRSDRPSALLANRSKRGAFLYWAALFTLSAAVVHFLAMLLQTPSSGLLTAFILIGAGFQAVTAFSVVIWPARRAGSTCIPVQQNLTRVQCRVFPWRTTGKCCIRRR